MTRVALLLLALACLLAAAGCAGDGGDDPPAAPAASTLEATFADPDGDGALERAPGEPLRDRTELAPARPPGRVLATLAQITDAHVRDEESPARVPFLDRLGGVFSSTFRPQEALSTQVLAAAVRAVDRLEPDAVLVTGDIVDSSSVAELDQAIATLDGGVVDPDTGAPGYDGVQAADDPDPLFYRPDLDAPRHPGLVERAQRRFRSPGLSAPWYPALGNHDLLVQGETPATPRIDAVATGGRMVVGLDPGLRPSEDTDSAAAVDALLAAGAPGRAIDVPADPDRRLLEPGEAIARLTGRERAPAALRAAAGRATLDVAFDAGAGARRPRARARHGRPRGRLARRSCARSSWPGCARSSPLRPAGRSSSSATTRSTTRPGARTRSPCSTPRRACSPSWPATRTATGSARARRAGTGRSPRPRWRTSRSRAGRCACARRATAMCWRRG